MGRSRNQRRNTLRLVGHDYTSPGKYFLTICVDIWNSSGHREQVFGRVVNGEMIRNDAGNAVLETWNALPEHYTGIRLDSFIVMPDHVHGILIIDEPGDGAGAGFPMAGAGLKPAPAPPGIRRHGLSEIVRGFKTFSARRVNALFKTPGTRVWQRNFHDRILRNELDVERCRRYIAENPIRWEIARTGRRA